MDIFIKTLSGETVKIEVNKDGTIYGLQCEIEFDLDISTNQQRLIFAGKQLEEKETLLYQTIIFKENQQFIWSTDCVVVDIVIQILQQL